jgi:hypothetical protein
VFSSLKNKNTLLHLLTKVVVSLFLLQSAIASVGMTGRHRGSASNELCASFQTASGDIDKPVVPVGFVSHHSFCCVLHNAAIDFPPRISHAYLTRRQFPGNRVELSAAAGIPDLRAEPSGAPQSPRAPPFFA